MLSNTIPLTVRATTPATLVSPSEASVAAGKVNKGVRSIGSECLKKNAQKKEIDIAQRLTILTMLTSERVRGTILIRARVKQVFYPPLSLLDTRVW